jgi:hypothetical protein
MSQYLWIPIEGFKGRLISQGHKISGIITVGQKNIVVEEDVSDTIEFRNLYYYIDQPSTINTNSYPVNEKSTGQRRTRPDVTASPDENEEDTTYISGYNTINNHTLTKIVIIVSNILSERPRLSFAFFIIIFAIIYTSLE